MVNLNIIHLHDNITKKKYLKTTTMKCIACDHKNSEQTAT